MQLPFLTTVDPEAAPVDPFRMVADFQDVIDAAADAGIIDDEAAVVFHRQLIAWSRATAGDPEATAREILDAAHREAADIIARARDEVADIRSLTLAECDEVLDAARAAADRLLDDATATAS